MSSTLILFLLFEVVNCFPKYDVKPPTVALANDDILALEEYARRGNINSEQDKCNKIECNIVYTDVNQTKLVTRCDSIQWKKECSNCTMICYPMSDDLLNCDQCPPPCETICEQNSCVEIPTPFCQEVQENVIVQVPVNSCQLVNCTDDAEEIIDIEE